MERLIRLSIKLLLFWVICFLLFCIVYFFKSRLPFQFSEEYSISKYFPFKYLAREKIIKSSGQVLMSENFNQRIAFSRWYHIWKAVPDEVDILTDRKGLDESGCLTVQNRGDGSWVLSPAGYLSVPPNAKIRFECHVMTVNPDQTIEIRINGFDENKNKIREKFVKKKEKTTPGVWQKIFAEFTVPYDVKLIVSKLRGTGVGETQIDNIYLRYY